MVRNCFVREEGERLILCAGVAKRWLKPGVEISFGPAPTAFGTVSVTVKVGKVEPTIQVTWQGEWHTKAPEIEVRLLGLEGKICPPGQQSVEFPLEVSV